VERRTVLKWAAATVAFVGFEIHGTGAAFASGDVAIAPPAAGLTPVLVPGAVQAADAPIELGLMLGGSTLGLPSGAILAFEFDPRLYEIHEAVTAQSGSAPVAVTGPIRATGDIAHCGGRAPQAAHVPARHRARPGQTPGNRAAQKRRCAVSQHPGPPTPQCRGGPALGL
jgi:hypothetical protein